ncbi:MAG: hypothetical protein CMK32_03890 [Porticoccaceae bacterium]|nr:hypothetical protein [Porticoccaceae bacterium]
MTEKEALIEDARQFFEELPPGEQEEMIGLTRTLIDFIKKNRGKGEAITPEQAASYALEDGATVGGLA